MLASPALTKSRGRGAYVPSPYSTVPTSRHQPRLCLRVVGTPTASTIAVISTTAGRRTTTPKAGTTQGTQSIQNSRNIVSFQLKVSANHKVIKRTSFGFRFYLKRHILSRRRQGGHARAPQTFLLRNYLISASYRRPRGMRKKMNRRGP